MNDGLSGRFASVYAWLLRLYPRQYQSEFAEERQEVFTLVLNETAVKGNRALIRLMVCELRDFPASVFKANWREWEAIMKKLEANYGEDRLSWIGLLLGLWPFIFLGPVMAVLPYLPQEVRQMLNYETPLWLAVVILSAILGVVVGWRTGFPRWVYPYLVIVFFVIVIPLLAQLSLLLGPNRFNPWVGLSIILVAFLGLGAAAVFGLSRISATRKIVRDIRADWTRVSFGMVVYLAFLAGFYGGDHLPPFGPGVWLPSAAVVLGAAAYLFCRSRLQRSLVLIATLILTFLGKFPIPTDDEWSIFPVLLLVLLFFMPALVELLPRRNQPGVEEK